jgi:Ni/Co efflux regulator RcnB
MKIWLRAALALSLLASYAALGSASPGIAAPQPTHAVPQRGDHLPADLIKAGPNVDTQSAHLRRPPAGYGWFSLSGVFVLASVTNGLIVEVVTP